MDSLEEKEDEESDEERHQWDAIAGNVDGRILHHVPNNTLGEKKREWKRENPN